MPRALTPEEKRQRNLAPLLESAEQQEPMVRSEAERANPESKRRTRGAFNGTTGKLSINLAVLSPDYHYHWLNDSPGRIPTAVDNGYEFVTVEEAGGAQVERLVGVQDNGEPLKAFFMKIRKDWYEEDQAALQGRIDRVDHAIKSGKPLNNAEGDPNFYDTGSYKKMSDRF